MEDTAGLNRAEWENLFGTTNPFDEQPDETPLDNDALAQTPLTEDLDLSGTPRVEEPTQPKKVLTKQKALEIANEWRTKWLEKYGLGQPLWNVDNPEKDEYKEYLSKCTDSHMERAWRAWYVFHCCDEMKDEAHAIFADCVGFYRSMQGAAFEHQRREGLKGVRVSVAEPLF